MMKNPDKKSKNPPAPTPAKASETAEGRGDDSTPLALTAPADCGGARLDHVLAGLLPQHSRNRLQGWIRDGRVQVGGLPVSEPKHKLWGGEAILVEEVPDETLAAAVAEDIPLDIVYEDEALIVIDKPAGLVVHPAAGNWTGTLMNGLLAHHAGAMDLPRAGIVHRLDKDTSGLMVVGKTIQAVTALSRAIAARTVSRQYLALVHGSPLEAFSVNEPIGRDPVTRVRMAVVASGKEAKTDVQCLLTGEVEGLTQAISGVRCTLHTGRTHQIRVHLSHRKYPLVADAMYGGQPVLGMARQALHATRLALVHPVTNVEMVWEAPLPADMGQAWAELAKSPQLPIRGA